MKGNEPYSLGEPARDIYERLKSERTNVVSMAERIASITVPSAFPPEDWKLGDPLDTPNQSIGASCVNNLAGKMVLATLPPGLPMASFVPKEHKLDEEAQNDPELWGKVLYSLSRIEEQHRQRMELTPARSVLGKAIRQHIIAGNVLGRWKTLNNPEHKTMHQYVVKRAADGTPLFVILRMPLSKASLDADMLEALDASSLDKTKGEGKSPKASDYETTVYVYECQKLMQDSKGEPYWVFWQELENVFVNGSESEEDYDTPPLYPGWLIPDLEGDWGVPYCFDYEGDLDQVETYAASLQDMAVDASYSLTLINPSGQTDIRQYSRSKNLSVIPGREEDVSRPKAQKGGDYQVVAAELEKAERRLARAFTMASAFQRSGERVTAEEWRALLKELDEAMGGLYSDFSVGFPRWFVLRFIKLHEDEAKDTIMPLPKDIISVGIKNGLDNIGQTTEYDKLMDTAKDAAGIFGPEGMASEINIGEFIKRMFTARSMKTDGLVKTTEQKSSEKGDQQNQTMQQTLLDKATGPIAKEGAGLLGQMLTKQQQETKPNG